MIAAIVRDVPDWTLLPGETPPAVRRVLSRCLERIPDDRLHAVADARIELERTREAAEPTPRATRRVVAAAAAIAAALAGLVGGRFLRSHEPQPIQLSK